MLLQLPSRLLRIVVQKSPLQRTKYSHWLQSTKVPLGLIPKYVCSHAVEKPSWVSIFSQIQYEFSFFHFIEHAFWIRASISLHINFVSHVTLMCITRTNTHTHSLTLSCCFYCRRCGFFWRRITNVASAHCILTGCIRKCWCMVWHKQAMFHRCRLPRKVWRSSIVLYSLR